MACSLHAVPPGLATRRADSMPRPAERSDRPSWESRLKIASSMRKCSRPVPGLAGLAPELDQEPDHPERRQARHVVLVAAGARTGRVRHGS